MRLEAVQRSCAGIPSLPWRARLAAWIEGPRAQRLITALSLGLEKTEAAVEHAAQDVRAATHAGVEGLRGEIRELKALQAVSRGN